ncbi:uncharacterized protein BDZ83DRAFT_279277 [Colletotrichum acutatum]|uniref:Uncharacterized protein n=1 Tax=Glomerella acutata TaxID=27357 RepID=A0AAD8UN66_GLOAC|nr:uncharacterized protein BDZ83DRAFT_279277 [Colletotrichum acutatum]KAK1725902.1 hypothetical protein BDZ83DRAFT_279277 [Colletotrichum acutatum]
MADLHSSSPTDVVFGDADSDIMPVRGHAQCPPIPSPERTFAVFRHSPMKTRAHYLDIGSQAKDSDIRRRISQDADSPSKLCFPPPPPLHSRFCQSETRRSSHGKKDTVQELQTLSPHPPSQRDLIRTAFNIGRPELSRLGKRCPCGIRKRAQRLYDNEVGVVRILFLPEPTYMAGRKTLLELESSSAPRWASHHKIYSHSIISQVTGYGCSLPSRPCSL